MKCVFVKDKGYRGMKEESDGGLRAVLMVGWSCGLRAPDGYLDVFDVGKSGVVEKLDWNSVDCYSAGEKGVMSCRTCERRVGCCE